VYPKSIGSTFNIYTDYTALDNHYIPSNFMGDGEKAGYLTLDPAWLENPHSGATSIRILYKRGPKGWSGIYWTDPENNWGQRPGGYDLTGVTRLTFWARSETPYRQLQILIGGISCYKARAFPYYDSVCNAVPVRPINLTTEWQQYTIDLSGYKRDWTHLLGGFGVVFSHPGDIYLDDIVYEFDQ
jgi:hypothetical protein